ncbi:MAG TPA: hypothetical protein PLD02_17055 [Saprospiraceae bacterium]|nr:hypothetical protein [Saprospiraceae bacterium]
MEGKSTKHFYDNFIIEITPIFQNYGFEYKKSLQCFLKQIDNSIYCIGVRKLSGGIEVELSLTIEDKLINEVLKEIFNLKKLPSHETIEWNAYQLKRHGLKNYSFFIMEPQEIEEGKKNILELINQFALPYFKKYSGLKGIDDLVNDVSEYPFLIAEGNNIIEIKKSHSTHDKWTVYIGLITAKLLNRSDFEFIKERNLLQLNRFDIEDKEEVLQRFNNIDWDSYRKQIVI